MVAVFTGLGSGFERGSAATLGASGLLGNGIQGRSGENVSVNAATGNLLISQQDEFLVGLGPDIGINRTYNSLGALDENGDNWRQSTDRRVYDLIGGINQAGSTIKRVSADGSEITYTYTGSGGIYEATDGAGAHDKLKRVSNVWTWTDGETRVQEKYAADGTNNWRITDQIDRHGNTVSFSYDSNGQLSTITTDDGGYLKYTWSGNNITSIETYADGATKTLTRTRYAYDSAGRLSQVTVDLSPENNSISDGKTYITTYTYVGTTNRVETIAQTDGSLLEMTYDGSGRVTHVKQTVSSGETRETELSYRVNNTHVIDATGYETALWYNNDNQLTLIRHLSPAVGASDVRTYFTYDSDGNVQTVKDPSENITSYTYDSKGNVLTITDPTGRVTTNKYDTKNYLRRVAAQRSDADSSDVMGYDHYVYNTVGQLRFSISAEGLVKEYVYHSGNNNGLLKYSFEYTDDTYSQGATIPNVAAMTSWKASLGDLSNNKVKYYEYDLNGNLSKEYHYGGSDAAGTAGVYQQGATDTLFVRDSSGQLLSRYTIKQEGATETFAYDGLGRLVQSTDANGGTTTIVFDDVNTKTVVTTAKGYMKTSVYNKAGDLISIIEPIIAGGDHYDNGKTSYLYDMNGRVRRKTLHINYLESSGETEIHTYYIYDKLGRLRAEVNQKGHVKEFHYDQNGRVAGEGRHSRARTGTELAGILALLDNPDNTLTVEDVRHTNIHNNGFGQSIWQWTAFDSRGLVSRSALGDGSLTTYEYDKAGRLVKTLSYENKLTSSQLTSLRNGAMLESSTLPSPHAEDSVLRTFYDRDGRAIGSLDAEGFLSEIIYDGAGLKVQESIFADSTASNLRASGAFSALLGSVSQSSTDDIHTYYAYDGQNHLRFVVDSLGFVTEYIYRDPNPQSYIHETEFGVMRQTIQYEAALNLTNYDYDSIKTAVSQLPTNNDNRVERSAYNDKGQLSFIIDSEGAVTRWDYDVSGLVIKTTQFAEKYNPSNYPTHAAMIAWVNEGDNSVSARITRNYYNERNELRAIVDAEGYATAITYDDDGVKLKEERLQSNISADDTTTLGDVLGARNSSNDAITTYTHDENRRVERIIDPNGSWREFFYGPHGEVSFEMKGSGTGEDESRTFYINDGAGRVARQLDYITQLNSHTLIGDTGTVLNEIEALRSSNKQYAVTLSDGGALLVSYRGEIVWSNGVEGDAARDYRLVAQQDGNLVVYDDQNNALWSAGTNGQNSTGDTFFEIKDDGNFVLYDGTPTNNQGEIWSTATSGVGDDYPFPSTYAETKLSYDGQGNLVTLKTITGAPAGTNDTIYTHDHNGRILTQTDAEGGVTQFEYDAFGNVVKEIDPTGNATHNYYDMANRLILTIDAEDYATATTYTEFGEIEAITRYHTKIVVSYGVGNAPTPATNSTEDATTHFAYDELGRLTSTTDTEGATESYELNAFGQRTQLTNKSGGITEYDYDGRGQLIEETTTANVYDENGILTASHIINKYTYDSRGNRTSMIEGFGEPEVRTTTYVYNKADQLIEKKADSLDYYTAGWDNSSSSGIPTENYTYDGRGNLIQSENANGDSTYYFYDRLNRVTHQVSAEGTFTRNYYDANSNIVETRVFETQISAPDIYGPPPSALEGAYRRTTFTYDGLNRMVESTVHDVQTAEYNGSLSITSTSNDLTTVYEYDANGNVIKVTDPNGNLTYSYYDSLNRKTHHVDAENYLTRWEYDADGNVTREYKYAQKQSGTINTSSFGNTTSNYPGGSGTTAINDVYQDRVTDYTYDQNGRRVTERRQNALVYNDNGSFKVADSDITYTYNALGQVTTKTEGTGDKIAYTYDDQGRLTREARTGDGLSYGYKNQDNTNVTPTVSYFYNALNDLSLTLGETEGIGILNSSDHKTQYTYGVGGRLDTVTDAAGHTTSYAYDLAGQVVREEYVRFDHDGTSQTEAKGYEYDKEGRVIYQGIAVYFPNGPDGTGGPEWNMSVAGTNDRVNTRYNAFGEVSERGLNGVYAEKFDYDNAGRVWRTTSGDGTYKYFMYDDNGNQTLAVTSDGTNIDNKSLNWVLDRWGSNRANIANNYVNGVNATLTKYDARNQAIEVYEPERQRNASARDDLTTSRSYNAFGDVLSETDARENTIDYKYNTMGRRIKVESPEVEIRNADGTTDDVRPTEFYYYDVSGRLVASRDANGNLTEQDLLAGTGYNGTEALIAKTTYADGGTITTKYDVHGNARKVTDQIGRNTTQNFDKMGRLTQINHAGGLTDNFAYDGLGQQIERWNNESGYDNASIDSSGNWHAGSKTATTLVKETTTYDQQGRVTKHVGRGGDITTTSYSWNASLATAGLGTFGGWTQTTTYANSKTLTEKSGAFGRQISAEDLGGNDTDYTYNKAGQLTSEQHTNIVQFSSPHTESTTYTYLNTGKLSTMSRAGQTGTYGYDQAGNLTSEFLALNGTTQKNGTANFDALGRMTDWTQQSSGIAPYAKTDFSYDANGNVRSTAKTYSHVNSDGTLTPQAVEETWFVFDTMNRVTVDNGGFENGAIIPGQVISYDLAGQRQNVTRYFTDVHQAEYDNGGTFHYVPEYNEQGEEIIGQGNTYWIKHFDNEIRENYTYNDAGHLTHIHEARGEWDGPNQVYVPPTGNGDLRSDFIYNKMGQLTGQNDYLSGTKVFDRDITLNSKGQVIRDFTSSKKGSKTELAATFFFYRGENTVQQGNVVRVDTSSGTQAQYALGATTKSFTHNSTIENGSTTIHNPSQTEYFHRWYDGAEGWYTDYVVDVLDANNYDRTELFRDNTGHLIRAEIEDGRSRDVFYTNDLNGQILARREVDNQSSNDDPREIYYRFGGREMGYTGNNSTDNVNAASAATQRTFTPGTGAFRNGASSGRYCSWLRH